MRSSSYGTHRLARAMSVMKNQPVMTHTRLWRLVFGAGEFFAGISRPVFLGLWFLFSMLVKGLDGGSSRPLQ